MSFVLFINRLFLFFSFNDFLIIFFILSLNINIFCCFFCALFQQFLLLLFLCKFLIFDILHNIRNFLRVFFMKLFYFLSFYRILELLLFYVLLDINYLSILDWHIFIWNLSSSWSLDLRRFYNHINLFIFFNFFLIIQLGAWCIFLYFNFLIINSWIIIIWHISGFNISFIIYAPSFVLSCIFIFLFVFICIDKLVERLFI